MTKLAFDEQGFTRIGGALFMRRDVGAIPFAVMSGNFHDCRDVAAGIDGATLLAPANGIRGRATWIVAIELDPATLQPIGGDEAIIAYDDEPSPYWIAREGAGLFRLYRNEATGATRCGTYHFRNDAPRAFTMALSDCFNRSAQWEFDHAA